MASKAKATSTTRKLFLDERNDNAKFGSGGHQNCADADNRVDWLSKLGNQEQQKRELTNTSDLSAELSLNEFLREQETEGLAPEVVADVQGSIEGEGRIKQLRKESFGG